MGGSESKTNKKTSTSKSEHVLEKNDVVQKSLAEIKKKQIPNDGNLKYQVENKSDSKMQNPKENILKNQGKESKNEVEHVNCKNTINGEKESLEQKNSKKEEILKKPEKVEENHDINEKAKANTNQNSIIKNEKKEDEPKIIKNEMNVQISEEPIKIIKNKNVEEDKKKRAK